MTKAQILEPITTVTRYVLMLRYGADLWSPLGAYETQEEAQENAVSHAKGCTGWKVVEITGLPLDQPEVKEVDRTQTEA